MMLNLKGAHKDKVIMHLKGANVGQNWAHACQSCRAVIYHLRWGRSQKGCYHTTALHIRSIVYMRHCEVETRPHFR